MNPSISEFKYLGGSTLDFVEVRIPDDYPDPENLVLVIYDRSHDGSTTATPSASDMYAIESVGDTSDDTSADGVTHYIIGSAFTGSGIALHAQDAVGLYNSVTGETYGLYSFGNSYTVSTAALQPDGTTADPFAGEATTVLPASGSIGDSIIINTDGTYTGTSTPTPGSSFICFCDGTEILTDTGPVLVEDLRVGDLVWCKDSGFQPIRWVGRRDFCLDGPEDQALRPVLIEAGALGPGCPARDLTVSPNHCVRIEHSMCDLYFGETEMLVPAKHLIGLPGVRFSDIRRFGYFHILLDAHELIQANGVWTESLFFGDSAKTAMGSDTRKELALIFPGLECEASSLRTRLPVAKRFEATLVKDAMARPHPF